MTSIYDLLLQTDHDLFIWLNGINSTAMDHVMYLITFKFTWIPLYLVMVVLTVRAEKTRSWAILLTVVVAVVVADKITSGIMKPYFMRLRPCHDASMKGIFHGVGECGGLYGFASSHASTSFALAMSWYLLLKDRVRNVGWLLVWAAVYSYSRVYVGVHYPGDILTGAAIGLLTGLSAVSAYRTFLKKYYHN